MRSHLMIKKFFLRTFVRIMLPIIIPVAVFSSLILFTAVRELYRQEEEEYGQGFELWCASLEEAVNELEWINLTLSTNPAITGRLLSILESADEGLKAEDYPTFDAISELIYGTLTLHSYVDSIYICFDGSPYFLNGNEIDHLPEGEPPLWYETYQQMDPSLPVWTKVYEREQVLSLYRRIYAYGSRHCLGAIVLNIDLDSLRELCDSLEGEKENILYICSAEGLPLFGNEAFYGLQGSSLDSSRYHVETQVMSASGWTIRAAIPLSVLYRAPARLTIMSVIILLGSILLCVLTALSCAYRDSRNMESIITAIEEAKRRNSLPAIQEGEETEGDMKADEGDAYGYILQNTVHAFLHKDYLAMQLAERRHYEKELEYMALRSQLNPHFLFNTLETIRWKTIALSGGENEASSMLENLSDLLRYCLQSEQEE
ncbi:MAG: histidine kinase, partial [Blautia sp.]|nr:histidine kinase [Blautia sp.]